MSICFEPVRWDMAETIYLHIGANKTGSSAIQHYLNSNRALLIGNGILYPVSGCMGDAHYKLSNLLGFVQGESKAVDFQSKSLIGLYDSIRKEIDVCDLDKIVFSSEYFVLPESIEVVRKFFVDFNIKIIVYVRRHDKWWPSSYNQAVRTVVNPPWGRGFRSYLNYYRKIKSCSSRGDYRLLLDRWAEVFGKENIIVRPYEFQQNKPNIISDFLRAIGREDALFHITPRSQRVNDSVDMTTLALVDAFQRAKIDPGIRSRLIRYVLDNKIGNGVDVSIEPELLLSLVEQYQDDYEYIAREYLGREDGVLFYDPLPDTSVPWKKIKQPSPAEIVELVISIMSEQRHVLT